MQIVKEGNKCVSCEGSRQCIYCTVHYTICKARKYDDHVILTTVPLNV